MKKKCPFSSMRLRCSDECEWFIITDQTCVMHKLSNELLAFLNPLQQFLLTWVELQRHKGSDK